MKKIVAIVAAAGIVGFAGAALAHHNDDHNPPGNAHGVYGCPSPAPGVIDDFKNPGKAFQFARAAGAGNPKQIADDADYDNVGALIADNCGNPD